jgi:hypothetical protein
MIANLFKESDIANIRIKLANDMVFSHKNTGNKGLVTSFNHKVLFFCIFSISYFGGCSILFLHSDIIQFINCSLRRVGAIELPVDSYVFKLLDVCAGSTFLFPVELRFSICHGAIYAL